MENLQEILMAYVPSLTVLVGFLASCIGVLKHLKKSDLTKIRDEIKDDNSTLNKRIGELIDLTNQLMQDNEYLRIQNGKLLAELTRISDYKEE